MLNSLWPVENPYYGYAKCRPVHIWSADRAKVCSAYSHSDGVDTSDSDCMHTSTHAYSLPCSYPYAANLWLDPVVACRSCDDLSASDSRFEVTMAAKGKMPLNIITVSPQVWVEHICVSISAQRWLQWCCQTLCGPFLRPVLPVTKKWMLEPTSNEAFSVNCEVSSLLPGM